MSIERKIAKRTARRKQRVKAKFKANELPRISVFRSLNNIYAQLINDLEQVTITSCSSLELAKSKLKDFKGDKKALAFEVGKELAERALEKGIKAAIFDRGQFLYHGRVESLAQGLREGGLKI